MARKRAKGTYSTRDGGKSEILSAKASQAPTYSQVVAERAELSSLVLQIVDELAVLAILARENLLELEYGSVDSHSSVQLEDIGNLAEDGLAKEHVGGVPILGALLVVKAGTESARKAFLTHPRSSPWAS